jgi:hypothetical protein
MFYENAKKGSRKGLDDRQLVDGMVMGGVAQHAGIDDAPDALIGVEVETPTNGGARLSGFADQSLQSAGEKLLRKPIATNYFEIGTKGAIKRCGDYAAVGYSPEGLLSVHQRSAAAMKCNSSRGPFKAAHSICTSPFRETDIHS